MVQRDEESAGEKEHHLGRSTKRREVQMLSRDTGKLCSTRIRLAFPFQRTQEAIRGSASVPCNILGNLLVEAVDEGNGVSPRDVAAGDGRVQLKSETPQHRVHQQRQSHHLKCKTC